MRLNELFVRYNEVEPIKISEPQFDFYEPIYANFDRAHAVASESEETSDETPEETPTDTSSWRVQSAEPGNWRVNTTGAGSAPTPEPASTGAGTVSETPVQTTPSSNTESRQVGRWNSVYKGQRDKWVADMVAAYRRAGLSDNAIRNLLAKNAGESGWGNTAQGAYNFGNITTGRSWKGMYVAGRDHNGAGQVIGQRFRAYNNLDEYVQDEIQFLTRLYDFNPDDDINTFIYKLQGGNKGRRHYAEAKNYGNLLRSVYNSVKNLKI